MRLGAFFLLSLALHGGGLWSAREWLRLPSPGFAFQLPGEVEFGVANAPDTPMPMPPGEESETPPSPAEAPAEEEASATEAGADAETKREKEGEEPVAPQAPRIPKALPAGAKLAMLPGAQIALRLDLKAIRNTPYSAEVKGLLEAIPDWRQLLEGSGIDPLEDLDRLMLASPNLQRTRLVVAGLHRSSDERVKEIVAQMAQARGVAAEWRNLGNVPVAPWANLDTTERSIALLGGQRFLIARPDDLPRVLHTLVGEGEAGTQTQGKGGRRIDLLSMRRGSTVSMDVDNLRRFVARSSEQFPEKAMLDLRYRSDASVDLEVEGRFATAAEAEAALPAWERLRGAYRDHFLVSLAGLRSVLDEMEIATHAEKIVFRAKLSESQLRTLLGLLQDLVRR